MICDICGAVVRGGTAIVRQLDGWQILDVDREEPDSLTPVHWACRLCADQMNPGETKAIFENDGRRTISFARKLIFSDFDMRERPGGIEAAIATVSLVPLDPHLGREAPLVVLEFERPEQIDGLLQALLSARVALDITRRGGL